MKQKKAVQVTMDDKGRISLAALLPPEERGGTWIVTPLPDGGFMLERAVIISASEYASLQEARSAANA